MKIIKNTAVLLLCLALLCSCGANKSVNNSVGMANTSATDAALEETATHETYSEEQIEALENPEELAVGDTFTVDNQLFAIGSIKYTITAARVIAPGDDVGLEIEDFVKYDYILTSEISYPDFLTGNGQLVDGCYLVQLDIHVENIDAVSSEEEYGDTALFRADSIHLGNLEHTEGNGEVYNFKPELSPHYFTGLNEFTQHPMLFRLEQGQSADYTIGYLVNAEWAVQEADRLRATVSGRNGAFEVNLKMEASA